MENKPIEGVTFFTIPNSDITAVRIETSSASLTVSTYGAHVLEWRLKDDPLPVIYLSDNAIYKEGKAIRGGIPLCWPWFGGAADPDLPAHGFARTSTWEIDSVTNDSEEAMIFLKLTDTPETRKRWDHPFELRCRILLNANTLIMALDIFNSGDAPFAFSAAFHNYFRVSDIAEIAVHGLESHDYMDLNDNMILKTQPDTPLIIDGPVDRDYGTVLAPVVIHDPKAARKIETCSFELKSVTVWNPWAEVAKKMTDLGDDDYLHFVCVEPAVLPDHDHAIIVEPKHSRSISQMVTVRKA